MPRRVVLFAVFVALGAAALAQPPMREWLPGDSHIHSHWSPGYDRRKNPPEAIIGMDAMYATPKNAAMARQFGLRWMVTTDHGGPNHAKLNLTQAYQELKSSRRLVPDLIQFYGMELNMPAMDHHTLIVPRTADEWSVLFELESRFDANQVFPREPARHSEAAARAALLYMARLPRLPLVFANHPSRSAPSSGGYGLDEPREFRAHNSVAPRVYRGMEGGPGHQAGGLATDGAPKRDRAGRLTGSRGGYRAAPTRGGFDPMTSVVGGLWDALLAEGRRFWIVASSDSHTHYTETSRSGADFWPGEFHKTYVFARPHADDILDGLRGGRMFAVAGDVITALDVTAASDGRSAAIGGELRVRPGQPVRVTVRFRAPARDAANRDKAGVTRIDVITGQLIRPPTDANADHNPTTRVIGRFGADQWRANGADRLIEIVLPPLTRSGYLRIRGTNTFDLEPLPDQPGENPWTDLWFYSNPIFLTVD
ncbi:MAG TPA: hypothetical protein VNJ02_14395 [Vicinamibacterales bacterium]|nr:hypothetical protein [Vicinamibacterales bacterium]